MMWVSAAVMLAIGFVPLAPSVAFAIAGIFLLNAGRACWGALFLAFNQDIAPGRVSLVAGIMGCIGSFMGALLVWLIGWVTKTSGFEGPFWMIAALVVAGTIPVALAGWEDAGAEKKRTS
jgi:hypothetical protein